MGVDVNNSAGSDAGPGAESAASHTSAPLPQAPPDVTGMLPFSMDSPGGVCAVSLSLMSLGLLSVSISMPKQMVVVDSSLVDKDLVKRWDRSHWIVTLLSRRS